MILNTQEDQEEDGYKRFVYSFIKILLKFLKNFIGMENIDDANAFWSVNVKPNSTKKVKIPKNVVACLTNASLSFRVKIPNEGSVTLFSRVNSKQKIALVPFTVGKYESTNLDLQFADEDLIEFSVEGNVGVDLSGYLIGGFNVEIE